MEFHTRPDEGSRLPAERRGVPEVQALGTAGGWARTAFGIGPRNPGSSGGLVRTLTLVPDGWRGVFVLNALDGWSASRILGE